MYEKEIAAIEKAAKFSEDDVLQLWMSRMVGDKDAPRAAQMKSSRRDPLGYYETKLFRLRDDRLIAQRLRFKDGVHFVAVIDWPNYRRVGWGHVSLTSTLGIALPRGHKFVVHSVADFNPPPIAKLRAMLWEGSTDKVIDMCRLFGINYDRVLAGSEAGIMRYRRNYYHSGYSSATAKEIMHRYTNMKKYRNEQRARLALGRAIEQHRDKVHEHMRPFNVAVDTAHRDMFLVQGTNREPTADEVFAHVGYTPQPNDLFKLLTVMDNGGHRANNGWWPAVGKWTEKQEVYPCRSGWHLTEARDVPRWQSWGPDLFLAEGAGRSAIDTDKVVFAQARLVRHIAKIDWAALKTKVNFYPDREPKVKAVLAAHEKALAEHEMATNGYGGMATDYTSPEQEYIRRLTNKNIPLNK